MGRDFGILGPLSLGGSDVRLPQQAQVLLGVLLLRANEVVSAQRLADEIWGERPPASWANAIQVYVSRIRKVLAAAGVNASLRRHGPGYALEVPTNSVDAAAFEQLTRAAGEIAGRDPGGAAVLLREALELWRGPALDGLTFESAAAVEIARLHERRLQAIQQRLEIDLALGRHVDVVPELEQLVLEHPFREQIWCMLVVALYRSGRQADALATCRRARTLLVEELGLDPSDELRSLEARVLRQDPSLEHPAAGGEPAASFVPRARRPVTAVAVCTSLLSSDDDPEVLSVDVSWRRTAEAVLEDRGATVLDGGPDAVIGLFGLPAAHEDDALRACRAALAVRDLLAADDTHASAAIAVESGELVVGGDRLPRGGLLSTVQRLTEKPGTVTLGRRARSAVGSSVVVSHTEGESTHLLSVERFSEAIARDLTRPLVGREAELELLERHLDHVRESRQGRLLVVSGPAGIGKSRLVAELASRASDRALVLRARCLPDEAGIAFAPLADLLCGLVAERGRSGLTALVAAEDDADEITSQLLALAGTTETVTSSREEAFRAFRKVLEGLALERVVLLVVEDLHWADDVLLDLLESVTVADGPVLVTCTSRPDVLAHRPSWAGESPRWSSIAVGPLPEDECVRLLHAIRPGSIEGQAQARIVAACAGNPLFLEQLAAMESEWLDEQTPPVPSSLRGLLLARLDRLESTTQAVLESASILSEPFRLEELRALTTTINRADVEDLVGQLVEREFLRRSGDGFVFAHPLIRTTMYETLPKQRRADLHEQFASLADATGGGATIDEVVGHHLERAFRYRAELRADDPQLPQLAAGARQRLGAAGRRRYERGDVTTAVSLLSRARDSALRDADVDAALLLDLGDALRESGRLDDAVRALGDAVDKAERAHDDVHRWRASASLARVELQLPGHPLEEIRADTERSLSELSRLGDASGLAVAWWATGWMTWLECRAAETEAALARSIEYARAAGNIRLEAQAVNLYLGAALFGPMTVEHAVERCIELRRRHHDRQRIVASCARALAVLRAMQGGLDEARALVELDRSILAELGLRYQEAAAAEAYGLVELLGGDPARAEQLVRSGHDQLVGMGDTGALPTVGALLAETLIELERYDEALRVADDARRQSDEHDLGAQVQWRCAHAKALAWRGRDKRALKTVGEALVLAGRTDFVNLQADASVALAEVHRLGGRAADSVAALTRAVELYKLKGNAVAASRAAVALRAARSTARAAAKAATGN
jgi:DNA-binding SARP family transcriptional activator/tetratricopeptide (TPR) repeat protein